MDEQGNGIMTANRSGEAGGIYCLFVPPNT
jgi:hypothetical protein